MLSVLVLAQAMTAVDAERAFNRAAQIEGQWTAFRRYADDNAVMFVPEQKDARAFLEPLKDPPIAVQWWPADSFVSCDGSFAVNTGPWVRPGASGYFTTVWKRQDDGGWKWVYDGGDTLTTPRALPETPRVRRASCSGKPGTTEISPYYAIGRGASRDGTLRWGWTVAANGARVFDAELWNGSRFETVVRDRIAGQP
ncbi:hypothetical protein [Sphingomonas sp.]|uniref:hypothetical protein n=1 Tax=Sphingomonas sp. TaxID=28214 RepID=UPI0025F64C4C|nr:hypothetical protein [Sphingomonas sp.]